MLQPPTNDQIWEGSPESPHTALNLRAMKKHLMTGGKVRIRKGLEEVTVKQGPKDHKRCEVDGLLLSVKTVNSDGGPLANLIDQEQALYIARLNNDHAAAAAVAEYFMISPASPPPLTSGRKANDLPAPILS